MITAVQKRQLEIGGDFSSGDRLELLNGPCTIFLNGDAMGKSMQGAGGALVLGTVYKSIIQRTQKAASSRTMAPEIWLSETFEELQSVFESFDGSMLVSLVVGLIEEESGMFYWINAEHPRIVLYREGVATFLEAEPEIRKLGVSYFGEQQIEVRSRRLRANDVLISGTDGRDDLLLGHDARGGVLMNENSRLFVDLVQAADGVPDRLFGLLREHGELTDDISMVRVVYREDASLVDEADILRERAALESELRDELALAWREERWAAVREVAAQIDREFGLSDTELFRVSSAARKLGARRFAAACARRYLLRAPRGEHALSLHSWLLRLAED